MRLTSYTDYSLRVLIYLACCPGRYVSTHEISRVYNISNNHLIKIVHNLGMNGFLAVRRGRHGGIALGKKPEEIVLGDVVRCTEPDFFLVECFDSESNQCSIGQVCRLKNVLDCAHKSFMKVLDECTLAEIVRRQDLHDYCECLGIAQNP